MNQIGLFLIDFWTQITSFFGSFNLQLFLLIGSGLLAVALLVLSLTTWGHAKPVWKCVVLSVAAHILLLGYAYGTHLILQVPAVAQPDNPVRINLVEDDGDSLNQNENTMPLQDWSKFVNQQLLPDVDQLERPILDTEIVLEREIVIPDAALIKNSVLELNESILPNERVDPENLHDDSFHVNDSVAAQEIEVQRRESSTQPIEDGPQFSLDQEIDRPEIAPELSKEVADNFTPPTDFATEQTPFTGELFDNNALLPASEPDLPSPRKDPAVADVQESDWETASPMRSVSTQNRIGDGKPLPEIYKLRAEDNRLLVVESRGGSIETEKAVQAALKWLAVNQQLDGSWDPRRTGAGSETKVFGHDRRGAGADADTGITALAVMAFMAGGNTHLQGTYQENVQKGLEFLLRNQAADGNLAGKARLFARMYCHSMSLLAASEALALTGDARLVPYVQRGVDYSVYAQNKTDGGWRYQPGDRGDMSQFGWQVLAMHSAKAGGIHVPRRTLDQMYAFLNSCCSGVGNGLASYRPNQNASTTMTAEALVCRFFLQDEVADNTKSQAMTRILRELPTEHHVNLYYWYYGTMAMYHTGGTAWKQWNRALKNALLDSQVDRGKNAGSWEPNGLWAGYGGRVYSTAMSALCLEVYYRYLPMYEVTAARRAAAHSTERQAKRIITLK